MNYWVRSTDVLGSVGISVIPLSNTDYLMQMTAIDGKLGKIFSDSYII